MIRTHAKNLTHRTARLVISDWDETLTAKDTISLLAEAAYLAKPSYSPSFEYFTNKYMDAYRDYVAKFEVDNGPRNSLDKEVMFQKGMMAVEMTSINELERLKLFEGLTAQQVKAQASKVTLRPGAVEFLRKCKQSQIPVVILSINWTKLIIEECLRLHGIDPDSITILVNELEFEGNISTGRWNREPCIRTAIDKLAITKKLIQNTDSIYIGDSNTDLLSMLECTVGVAIEDGSVVKSIAKFGLQCSAKVGEGPGIYVSNFRDINSNFEALTTSLSDTIG